MKKEKRKGKNDKEKENEGREIINKTKEKL